MSKGDLSIIESELNVLLDAVRESAGYGELEQKILSLIGDIHYEKLTGEDRLLEELVRIVRLSKPSLLTRRWEDAWSNFFSLIIQLILRSERSSEIIIEHLLGGAKLPPEHERELVLCVNPGSTSTKVAVYRGSAARWFNISKGSEVSFILEDCR